MYADPGLGARKHLGLTYAPHQVVHEGKARGPQRAQDASTTLMSSALIISFRNALTSSSTVWGGASYWR